MILKTFELTKVFKDKILLFHGQNNGHKDELVEKIFKPFFKENIFLYFEKDILTNIDDFYNSITSRSFFEENKLIIIKEITDKIRPLIETIIEKDLDKTSIILISNILDKKSKLRTLFEKDKKLISVPFYNDNDQTLKSAATSFFKSNNIPISYEAINILINKANGERTSLNNELKKINMYMINKKNITIEEIQKLTNNNESNNINELVDNCLAKNNKKIIYILNESIYTSEDIILILRTFLNKSKRLLNLITDYSINKNIDSTISRSKPPIFWKDKELVKLQIKYWTLEQIKNLLIEINQIELFIKKNSQIGLKILNDFILTKSKRN